MSVINVEHISKLYGDKMILEDLSCSVDEGDKIGIIGINGTGKSTLLRIIAGEEEADEGKIIFSNGMTIGWMGQNPEFDEESSILKYVCEGKKIEDDYGYESDAKAMLTVLELENFDEKIKNLSGGQKKRAALCKVLLQKPDILILDEPTNHLDNKMSDWLENYLKSFRGVLLMVTHDRYFLDKVTNHIWEVEGGKVYYYDENYSGYLERKAEREERELASERKRQSILRSEVKWVMRGARARSTKQKARLERFEQLKAMDSPKTAKQVEMGSVGTRLGKKTIELYDISKAYGDKVLFKHFSYIFKRFERIGFVGHNGCGKSTLMNVLSGIYPYGSYEGDIIYDGEVCKFDKIKDSEEKGIVIIHQELALIPYMTIGENMFLGNERGHKYKINWNETNARASELLKTVGLKEGPQTLIKDIGVGKQQLVEIAKALAKNAKLLILDEPTASLNETDSKALLDLMLELKKKGMTSIIISHKLNEISYVADKITVIRDGSTIETLVKGKDDITESRIIKGMVGREIADRFPKREPKIGDVRMEVKHWTVHHPLYSERKVVDDVNIIVKKGEVVGISGLMGAGRTELAMSLFGKSYGSNISGELYINGKIVHLNTVQEAIKNHLAYVTEDRKGNGLILSNPIKINTTLANLDAVSSHTVIDKDKEYNVAVDYKKKLNTKCPTVEQNVGNLSGGNQQKVLLAKWMFADPDILILDEPTRGIDVGAKYEIYCIINQLVAEGKSVIMISSELPEILGMCDRIYVMNEGKIVGELAGSEATQELIMSKILSAGKKGALA